MDLWPLLITFLIIGAAELGDKTQLLTLGFATKFPVWEVIIAVSCATAVLMALAVTFGGAINYYIPEFQLQLATLTLSAEYGTPIQVWLGATLGMCGVNVIAALTGSWIKKFVSEKTIKWFGAVIFILFGLFTLWSLFS